MKFLWIKKTGIVSLLVSSVILSGCASIVHGDHQKFMIESNPPHANLTVDGVAAGVTPKQINLQRKKEHVLKLNLAGYQPTSIHLEKTVSGWFIANILFGGIIGIAIDAVDGAMYKLTPEQMSEYAANEKFQYNEDKQTLTVILVQKANKSWQKIGKLKKSVK